MTAVAVQGVAGQSVEATIRRIIADVTLKPADSFGLDDDLPRLLSLDSLSLLRIVADIESAFDVRIADEEFSRLRSLRSLVQCVNGGIEKCGLQSSA